MRWLGHEFPHLVEGYNELARSYASDARRDDTAPAALA